MRYIVFVVIFGSMLCGGLAMAQSPGVLYTWAGTGNAHDWTWSSNSNSAAINTSTAGQIVFTELGDEIDPGIVGGPIVIRDGYNRRLESATWSGGLDLTGLDSIEIDLEHNGTGNVDLQFYMQATPDFDYTWAGSDGTLEGPDFSVAPGMQTLEFPLDILTPEQRVYIRTVGLSVRDHASEGNLTWTIHEVRSLGTPLTLRDLATHDVGTSDNGLNGAIANFDIGAIVGNDGGQNQTGLSQNTNGSGSLQWTDRGGEGTPEDPSGAAVTWYNGTAWNGNSFNERMSDFSNYNRVTFTMSATDALNGGGDLGLQGFLQTGNYDFQTASNVAIPIDGQYHDIVFPLSGVTDRINTQNVGLNLFAHTNDLVINVDRVRFEFVEGLIGDYNENDVIDAADYTTWRDAMTAGATSLPNDPTPGTVDETDFLYWRAHFGEVLGSGAGAGQVAVPEPSTILLAGMAWALCVTVGKRRL